MVLVRYPDDEPDIGRLLVGQRAMPGRLSDGELADGYFFGQNILAYLARSIPHDARDIGRFTAGHRTILERCVKDGWAIKGPR